VYDVEVIEEPAAAASALDPVRSRLLAELVEPGSAAALATRVGISRQKVNYHLRALDSDPAALTARGADAESIASALAELVRAGIAVNEFALGQPSLDEVFLALTGHPAEESADIATDDPATTEEDAA
jgi:hypothetical protein